jgi:hypothetical protein
MRSLSSVWVMAVALPSAAAVAQAPPQPSPAAAATATAAPADAPPQVAPAPPRPVARPVESIPGTSRLESAELTYVHPLYRPIDAPPKVLERPVPADLERRVPIVFTVHVLETGRVTEVLPVEPPLKALLTPVAIATQKWKFTPAKKGAQPVATWLTFGLELNVELEKAVFSVFTLDPVERETPLAPVAREPKGDDWMARYPKEIAPKDPAAVSIEDVDVLPTPDKTSWSFDAARVRSRVTALVEVSAAGAVSRILPTGDSEPLLVSWIRQAAPKWKISAATAGGKPVVSWMTLDLTIDYTVTGAKKKAERIVKKNLRTAPAP